MNEDIRASVGEKITLMNKVRKNAVRILLSCLGFVLLALYLISEYIEEASLEGFIGIFTDITILFRIGMFLFVPVFIILGYYYQKQRILTEQTETGRKRLETYLESMVDGVGVAGANGTIIQANKALARMHGYKSSKQLIRKPFFLLVPKRAIPGIRKRFMEAIQKRENVIENLEVIQRRKDSKEFPAVINITNLWDEKGEFVGNIAVIRDITERKRMEERLLKAERLAAIGEMAAMVGHDMRNPLTGISTAAYYLKMKLGSKLNKKAGRILEIIDESIEYSNKIISDLLDYSREIRLEPTETTPKAIMKEALSMVEVPKSIDMLDATQNEPKIKVDVEKMKRVFVNIIKNAVDAMPKGGKLTLKSRKTNSDLEIAFIDTGIGMSKEIMEKLWTPFFTTKTRGMGLGLPICARIVEAHGGKISVESLIDKGTTFIVTIPIKPRIEESE